MFLVCNTFSKLDIKVHGAILSTEAQVAMDSFYITDKKDKKIVDKHIIDKLKEKLNIELISQPLEKK